MNKWVMNRAGLVNFWYYDEETFNLQDGKLLLRGTNGSGKSVTMQSFLPVLLDGKKSPDRLDPFGSKARKMEDYLLGEKEITDRDERTGYLFLEYKKQDSDQYMTTGIGMQAKRNKGIKSWYFIITDNRRVGGEMELTQTHLGEKVPFSAKELENRIGHGGYVVHSQKEYMELVNKHVFGFSSIDAYEDLIKLLIQLRSPKLSKDFKPTVIYEILESALPPLTDDELRHLSDTIESMDQAQQQLEQLKREKDSIQKLESVYHKYNQYILAERTEKWSESGRKCEEAKEKVERLTEQSNLYEREIEELQEGKQQYIQQKHVAEQERKSLEKHEVWDLEETKGKKLETEKALYKEVYTIQEKWDNKNGLLYRKWEETELSEKELSGHNKKLKEHLEELQVDAEEAAFDQHEVNIKDYERNGEDSFDFSVWKNEAKQHKELLSSLQRLAEESERLGLENSRLQRSSSEKKQKMDELHRERDHLEEWFDEQKQLLESDIFSWIQRHSKLTVAVEDRQEIARFVQGLYDRNRYDDVKDRLFSAIHDYEVKVKGDLFLAENKEKVKRGELKEAEIELVRLKEMKMVEPARAQDTVLSRGKLVDSGQTFIPFYAAVEFKEHVSDQERERIEAALKRTGILDSLITDSKLAPVHDSVITTDPKVLGHTLADYLIPDLDNESTISSSLVDEVLRSIPLEQDGGGFHIDADGTYSIGCMIGHAPSEGPSKFIGRSSRKRHQREKILLCEQHIILLEKDIHAILAEIKLLKQELQQIDMWKRELPHDKELAELYAQLQDKLQKIQNEQELLQAIDRQWKENNEKLEGVKVELRQKGLHLNINLQLEELKKATEAAESYMEFLNRVIHVYLQMIYSKKQLKTHKDRIQELEEELDEIKGELNGKATQLSQVKAEITSIEEQLKLKGIHEIRARIQEVLRQLQDAQRQLDHIQGELPAKHVLKERCLEDLQTARSSLWFWENMQNEWKRIVEQELEYGFIKIEERTPASILSKMDGILEKNERAKLSEQMSKAFFNEQLNLTEYRMFEYTKDAKTPEWFDEDFGEFFEPLKNEWHQLKGRRLILMEYQGQRVSPYFISNTLNKELEDQQGWLDEQDRQLYEDIIVNTVGIILRNRIQRAQKWVKEMDKIMASRDNSSGLTFSITWKPLTAESEDELDTSDLVQLLQRNSKFLNEEDLNSITKHFQSRIGKAKELIQLRNEGSTLRQVLKEVLDYRKWFSFILAFKRVGENKKELTNNAFFKFSGGEKAMAMYIPLFTAAYSRYKEANAMAPYIISLDEAFAGVDENNIRDMFEVVEQLGFNYMMNSQALWGDYDTISSLSIYELVRPKNAPFVTVIRYLWDGKQKSLVLEDEATEELMLHE